MGGEKTPELRIHVPESQVIHPVMKPERFLHSSDYRANHIDWGQFCGIYRDIQHPTM